MRSRLLLTGIVLLACVAPNDNTPSVVQAGTPRDADSIPVDRDRRVGQLPNGVRYYLRYNRSNDERTELRLVVDAGSALEDDSQRGLAHAVEHLAIRSSQRFPERAAEQYFASLGMRRGEGINGSTSLDETTYRITIPSRRRGALDTALAMLSAVATEAQFDAASARVEAGVIMEEWRSSRDAGQRIYDAHHEMIFAGTPYAARRPIGDTAVIRRFDLAAMRRFYADWYRPDLMAVVAVGDFSVAEVEAMIRTNFEGIAPPKSPRPRPRLESVSPPPGLRAMVVTDSEVTVTRAGLWFIRKPAPYHTKADFKAALIRSLWMTLLADRLDDASLLPGSPISRSSVESRYLARPVRAYVASATARPGNALAALEAVASEVARLARDGPGQGELATAADVLLGNAESRNQSGEDSEELVDELIDEFLTGNSTVTRAIAYDLRRELLPSITVDEVKAFAETVSTDRDAIAVLTLMAGDTAANTSADEILRHVRAGSARDRTPALDISTFSLPEVDAAAGRVVSEQREYGVIRWGLSNGMEVMLKPSRYSYGDIVVRLVAPGGASLAADSAFASAYMSDRILEAVGAGNAPISRLNRWLHATTITFEPIVEDDAITLKASASAREVDDLFKVLRMYMHQPRRDTVAFRRFREEMLDYATNRGREPTAAFEDSIESLKVNHHPRGLRSTPSFYQAMDLDQALAFWTARMNNASAMKVAIVGDFTLDKIKPIVEKYLASIPRGEAEHPVDAGIRAPRGVITRELRGGISGRARSAIVVSGPFEPTNDVTNALGAVRDVIDIALSNRLRETMGGTYDVTTSFDIDAIPPGRYTLTVDFESSPDRIAELSEAAVAELQRLRREGPTEAEFAATREARIRDHDGDLSDDGFWVAELSYHARMGWPLSSIRQHAEQARSLTLAELRAACATYIDPARSVRVILRPRSSR
jgi:zinc protease